MLSTMVGSWEIETVDSPSKWFALAHAYLDASTVLCQAFVQGSMKQTFSHAQVVMGLAHHSVELFLKGAIHSATGKQPPNTHNLFDLDERFRSLWPNIASEFTLPFGIEPLPPGLDETQVKREIGKTNDQKFRYHTDPGGNPWNGIYGFQADSFLKQLLDTNAQYKMLIPQIIDQAAS